MIIELSAVVACISFTVTQSKLFEDLRSRLKRWPWHELLNCCFCFGFWVSFVLCAIYRPRVFYSSVWLLDYVLTAFLIAWIAGVMSVAFSWLMDQAKL